MSIMLALRKEDVENIEKQMERCLKEIKILNRDMDVKFYSFNPEYYTKEAEKKIRDLLMAVLSTPLCAELQEIRLSIRYLKKVNNMSFLKRLEYLFTGDVK